MRLNYSFISLSLVALGLSVFHGADSTQTVYAASKATASTTSQETIIEALRGLVTVDASYTETITYDSQDMQYLNSTDTYEVTRDYGYIVEEDGSHVEAVRFFDDTSSTIYYKGDDNYAYYETLKADNTVETHTIIDTGVGLPIAYSKYFRNPWNYISADDISDDLILDTHKASFLLETYFGIERGVAEARLIIDEQGLPTGIDITVADLVRGQGSSDGSFIESTSHIDMTLSYKYGETDLRHLSPSTNSNPELETAIGNLGSNFTMTMTSSALAVPFTIYSTDDYVFVHSSIQKSVATGDMLLRYETAMARYSAFTYNESTNSWTRSGYLEDISALLPGVFSGSINTALFGEVSDGIYSLIPDSVGTGACELMIPVLQGFDTIGLSGYVKVQDGRVTALSSTYDYSVTPVTLTVSVTDYTSTVLPSYVDVESL